MAKHPSKPYVDIEDPAEKPSLEDLGSGPAERALFGSHGGMSGLFRFLVPLALFLLIAGSVFYFTTR